MIRGVGFISAVVAVAIPGACPTVAAGLRTVAVGGDAASPVVNNLGQVAFLGLMQNPDGPGFIEGVWSEGTGQLQLVAARGQHAPGTPPGAVFLHIHTISFNDRGHVAFEGELESGSGGVMLPDTTGIWSEGSGALELVARLGSQAPGISSFARFDFFHEPVLSNSGDVAFSSLLDRGVLGSSDSSIWVDNIGQLEDRRARRLGRTGCVRRVWRNTRF
ncbi:MAG: hypothetical protein L0228_11600 [Planctomycetes bacterium]|nr:hypothetical protein [Planctomycetota bacterium]